MTFEKWWKTQTTQEYECAEGQLIDALGVANLPRPQLKRYLRVVWNEAQAAAKEAEPDTKQK